MTTQDPDSDLVERARQGDSAAFSALVANHQRLLTSLALGMLKDEGRAEDAVQEAFLSAWRALGSYRGEARFRNWLCRILVNKAASMLRWGRLRQWLSLDEAAGKTLGETLPDPSADASPEQAGLQEEHSRAVREAVAALPLQQRTAVLLRANGLDVAEVAQTMGVAEGTVKAHLHQARSKLAVFMEER